MSTSADIIHVMPDVMESEFGRILLENGFSKGNAIECARIFTLNSLEGVYSHGVNRFSRFIKYVKDGFIRPDSVPTFIKRCGSIEQWTGNLGPGPLNAMFATNRAIEIAVECGIGLVALANTNHWMRGGTYGWHAALKGYVFIGWTNTMANMPAWGAVDTRLGNNPLVIAVPYKETAIVLDTAMSQYSYGKMESLYSAGQKLPYPGGYNIKGELTTDPGEILQSWRSLPIGYWKGSGLSLLLDILASSLSGGLSVHEITKGDGEYNLSQVYIAIDLKGLSNYRAISETVERIINDLHKSTPENENNNVRYPGENTYLIKLKNQKYGIPVKRVIWEDIIKL